MTPPWLGIQPCRAWPGHGLPHGTGVVLPGKPVPERSELHRGGRLGCRWSLRAGLAWWSAVRVYAEVRPSVTQVAATDRPTCRITGS
jgi:hypothetical protein